MREIRSYGSVGERGGNEPRYPEILRMFLRKKKNASGSTSVQVISKVRGKYKVSKSIGSGTNEQEIEKLWYIGLQEIERLKAHDEVICIKD